MCKFCVLQPTVLRSTSSDAMTNKLLGLSGFNGGLQHGGIQQLITMPNGQIFAVGLPQSALTAAKQNVSFDIDFTQFLCPFLVHF